MRPPLWLVVIPACVATVPVDFTAGDDYDNEDSEIAPDANSPVTFDDEANYVDWHNGEGTFRIYKTCLGPNPGSTYIGHDGTVGPGYVATVWNKNAEIVLDDTALPANIGPNGGVAVDGTLLTATGLGMFGFHLLRKPVGAPSPFTIRQLDASKNLVPNGYNYAWQISGRWCNANRRPDDYAGYRGYGVRSFSTATSGYYVAPSVSANVGELALEVTLGDAYSDLVVVRYTYRVGSNYVKAWVRVTNVCSNGTCDDAQAGDAYVKEPKVIAGINPASPDAIGYQQMNIFNDTGHTAVTSGKYNTWNVLGCSRSQPQNLLCEWGAQDPRAQDGGGTGQCSADERRRARFWNPEVACANDPSCLVVAARGADTELGPSYDWQGPHGLDLWAQRNVSEGRLQADPHDSKSDGYIEASNCWNNSAAPQNRRWEMMGLAKTPACSYESASVGFHGWEGGTGAYDCEPLYYRFGNSPAGAPESYVVALSYGFGAAPLP